MLNGKLFSKRPEKDAGISLTQELDRRIVFKDVNGQAARWRGICR